MMRDFYRRFPGRSDWQRNNDGRFRTLWRHCRALRHHAYYTLLLACLCAIGIGCAWWPYIGDADFQPADARQERRFPLLWFPPADNPWGRQLNPKRQVPTSGFDACYFSLNAPTRPVARERVRQIAIKEAASGYGIAPNDFAAYWAGTLHVPAAGADYSFSPQGRDVRILLDGRVVYHSEGGRLRTGERPVTLTAGDYLLEVEFGGDDTFQLSL